MWRKGNPCALFVGMQIGVATLENSMESPQNFFKKWNYLMTQRFYFWEYI